MRLESLKSEWGRIFGDPLSIHTSPVEIRDGELLIHVDSPAWLNQLKFFREDMLTKLRPYGIKDLRFKKGSVYHRNPASTGQEKTAPPRRELTDQELRWIEENIPELPDEELRNQIRKTMERALGRKKV